MTTWLGALKLAIGDDIRLQAVCLANFIQIYLRPAKSLLQSGLGDAVEAADATDEATDDDDDDKK